MGSHFSSGSEKILRPRVLDPADAILFNLNMADWQYAFG
jgi:hypothetical protein